MAIFNDKTEIKMYRVYPETNAFKGILDNAKVEITVKNGILKANSELKFSKHKSLSVSLDLQNFYASTEIVNSQKLKEFAIKNLQFRNNLSEEEFKELANDNPIYLLPIGQEIFCYAVDCINELFGI